MPVRPYEVVYIMDPDLNEENSGAMVERFRTLAEAQGAADIRVDTETLGRRRLAYEINHKREGQYVVMLFQSEAAAPAEVERVLNITDGILRSMVVRLDEMPPAPEAPAEAPAAVETPAPEQPEATGEEAMPAGAMESVEQATTEPSFPTPNPADPNNQGQALTDATEPDQPAS